jgi:Tfp pilus assembly protein PilV
MSFGRRAAGMSLLETLIALPILLMFGLGALQAAMVLQARHALNFALLEAARSAYLGTEHSGAAERRPKPGKAKDTDI